MDRMVRFCRIAFLLLSSATLFAQGAGAPAQNASEKKVELALATARKNPLALRSFLQGMPKGADLHSHLSGAVYAESFIRAAVEDGLCVDPETNSFAKPQSTSDSFPPQPVCAEGKVPANQALKNQHLYDALVNAFSMRGWVPGSGVTGHDHFFDTFAKFGGTDVRHIGEWVDEVATRAAAQNEQYLELMTTPTATRLYSLVQVVGWHDDFKQQRDDLLARGLRDDVPTARAYLDRAEATRRQREHCGEAGEAPACKVLVRYIYQVARGNPKEIVFAQALLGFEVASADPRVLGINFVQPEDGYISMTDYALQMRMVGFLHDLYPRVHISLHAGELAFGLVPPEGLCCHIRLAVEQAHAERIGHGVDVMYEDRAHELLKEMAKRHVMVEINLTSNDVILGIRGKDHPFSIYRQFHVPMAFSTDDEGVSRIDLTNEYVRAVETYDLRYSDLKQLVRTGLEHSFLPGASLWRDADVFGAANSACAGNPLGGGKSSSSCAAFLKSSEKASQQWELERRFRV
ncbi:MAG TPA: adenosine deaminase, partial [Candidatus Angelobacter sp.]